MRRPTAWDNLQVTAHVRRTFRPLAVVAVVAGAVVLMAGCNSGTSADTGSTLSPLPSSTLAAWSTTSTSTTVARSTTTAASVDPSLDDIPEGECSRLVDGSIGFRNTTGEVADEYRRIGVSSEDRVIWSEHWGSRTGPQVLVLGQVHGDECTPAFMVRAIRERPPVDFGIWLVPTLNPDGLAGHHRRTALDVDPNRDGFDLATPEARAAMAITEFVQPILTVHLHSPYKWVGAHNGLLATQVATAMSAAAGWGLPKNAGRVRNGTQAFLWEGQELVIPGHPSVLVEFPAISDREAPDAPDPTQRQSGTVNDVRVAAVAMRDALYDTIDASINR
jgi:murein peptide amidase A